MLIPLLAIILNSGQILAFQRHLGLTIPVERVTYPKTVNTTQVKITLPGLDASVMPAKRNINSMIDLVHSATLFDVKNEATLWPLYDLGVSMATKGKAIRNTLKDFNNTESSKVGMDGNIEHRFFVRSS